MQATDLHLPDQLDAHGAAKLDALVGPDPHRPGPDRWRLLAEQMPIWTVIGHIGAIAGTTEPNAIGPATIVQVAHEYDISETAVLAVLHYYDRRRCVIDTLLEANAEALRRR